MTQPYIPTAVILHTPEYGDVARIQGCRGLDAPVEILSFTDTHPAQNAHNLHEDRLHRAVFFKADDVIIQEELLHPPTEAARAVISAAMLTSARRATLGTFDREYVYTQRSLQKMHKYIGVSL